MRGLWKLTEFSCVSPFTFISHSDILIGMKNSRDARVYFVEESCAGGSPAQIRSLRSRKLHLSQLLFAQVMGVSKQTVNSWECGWREPSLMARRFMYLLQRNPGTVDGALRRRVK